MTAEELTRQAKQLALGLSIRTHPDMLRQYVEYRLGKLRAGKGAASESTLKRWLADYDFLFNRCSG